MTDRDFIAEHFPTCEDDDLAQPEQTLSRLASQLWDAVMDGVVDRPTAAFFLALATAAYFEAAHQRPLPEPTTAAGLRDLLLGVRR